MAKQLVSVGIIMGSQSDWETMRHAAETLDKLGDRARAPHRLGPPHPRAPLRLCRRRARERGLKVIIAGAGGAAHLPGMAAALTPLPVFGVPVESRTLKGLDSLLSIVQMPAGIPVGTLAIGRAGAVNAALLAAAVLALTDRKVAARARRLSRDPDRQRRQAPVDETRDETEEVAPVNVITPGAHDRHPRRRPARPHDGAGRGASSAIAATSSARSAIRRRPRSPPRRPSRPMTTARR